MNFTATQFSTVEDKEWFFNQFKKFVKSGFKQSLFTKKFYTRLSMTFGMIAHYGQGGFWAEFFTTTADKARFLHECLQWGCYGDPAFTYCDVEKELQAWMRDNDILGGMNEQYHKEVETTERAQLSRLQQKYG